jgi:hypothetical protein
MTALKTGALTANGQGEIVEQLSRTATEAELQARQLEGLEILADWKVEIERKKKRLLLRVELIGGVDEEEEGELRRDADRLARCMQVFGWRVE